MGQAQMALQKLQQDVDQLERLRERMINALNAPEPDLAEMLRCLLRSELAGIERYLEQARLTKEQIETAMTGLVVAVPTPGRKI